MKTIAIINLKGGVGKSTTSMCLAETLACAFRQRVRVLDFDPQANLSMMMLGEDRLRTEYANRKNLYDFFQSQEVSFRNHMVSGASDIDYNDIKDRISILPSHPNMFELVYLTNPTFDWHQRGEYLTSAISDNIEGFDYQIIDCPPSFNHLTLLAIRNSDYIIVPTMADFISIYGLAALERSISLLQADDRDTINQRILGYLVVRYDSKRQSEALAKIRKEYGDAVFNTEVPYSIVYLKASEHKTSTSLFPRIRAHKFKHKYYSKQYQFLEKIVAEIINRIDKRQRSDW